MRKRPREQGSSGLTVLIAMVSLGLGVIYSQQRNQQAKRHIDKQRLEDNNVIKQIADNSSLARFRALLATKKNADGVYEPGIYPQNYFESDWVLLENKTVLDPLNNGTDTGIESSDSGIKISVKTTKDLTMNETAAALTNASEVDRSREVKTIKISKVNFDELLTSLVRTLEVDVITENASMIRARINVPAPVAYNPILELRAPGSPWSRSFSKIAAGTYELRVLASGVVFAADVTINGVKLGRVGGFGLDGKVHHEAVNPLAKDKEVGRLTYDFTDSSDFTVNPGSCSGVPLDGTFNYTIGLVGADGNVTETDFSQNPIKVVGGKSSQELSDDQFKQICSDECPYIEETPSFNIDTYRKNQIENMKFNDFSWEHHLSVTRNQIGAKAYKYCENLKPAYDAAEQEGLLSGVLSSYDKLLAAYNSGAGAWANLEYVAYKSPACKRKFLFSRNNCGCFADDTKIRMADGSEKVISELQANDVIWNPVAKTGQAIRRMTRGPEKVPMFRLRAGEREVVVTGTHPFATREGVVSAFQLQVGQEIRAVDGSWTKVDALDLQEPQKGETPIVWNLELDGPGSDVTMHFVEANGVVTGDLFLQNQLQKNKGSLAQAP